MPTVRSRRLAHELRRLREAAGLTIEVVAGRLECSASKISRVETGRVAVSPRDVRDIARIYGVSDDLRDSLIQLARDAREKGWWHAYGDTLQPHLTAYFDMESAACEIRIYRVSRIPGQLQTDDYTEALLATGTVRSPSPDQERQLLLLQERRRLASLAPPALWVVLDEAALQRQTGGPEVLRSQIEHLIGMSSTPDVFLQVIPYSGGANAAFDTSFAILSYPDPADADVVAIGYPTGVLWIEDTDEVRAYSKFFRQLQAAALSPGESAARMASLLKEV